MKTLTIEEATILAPAISANKPIDRASGKYQFVSTREILEHVQQKGWRITNATAQNQRPYAQHRVTLVHENSLKELETNNKEGVLRIELFNSHDRTKRLTFAIGYFRFVCSNGLIAASGPAETMRTKHTMSNIGNQSLEDVLLEKVDQLTERFPTILQKVEDLKNRQLTEQEQLNFASYAINGRYSYRSHLPKRFANMEDSASKILSVRREADEGNSAWAVYNRVQENIIRGVQNFNLPVKSYLDNIRVNTLLWKGADATLDFANEKLKTTLQEFLAKGN